MLLEAVKMQVETRLESSLHNRVYIIPDKDKNPSQVEHPWNIDVKSGYKPKFRLPKNTHIIKVFDQSGVEGRLLILGKPGAGKTTMLLELAKVLVQRAEQDLSEPVPILLSLSSWQNDQQSIADWIVEELNSGKSYKIRKYIAKQWLEEGEIIPLLDGLDELAALRQERCVQKLNQFLLPGNWSYPLVVCSRIEEYQLYSTQLALNTSVELQPFTEEKIQDYLRGTGNEKLWNSINNEQELRELAQTPFLLNIIVISCQKLSLEKWQKLKSLEERVNYLLSAYVEEMLARSYQGKRPSNEKTKQWLCWLALKMIDQNETEFFIEKMQPHCLKNNTQKRLFHFNVVLIVLLVFGLISERIHGLNVGIISAFLAGFIASLRTKRITPFESLTFSLQKLRYKLVMGLIFGLIGGLFVLLPGLLRNELQYGFGIQGGLITGSCVGLLSFLILGFSGCEITIRTKPNHGIKNSAQNAIIFSLIGSVVFGLTFVLLRLLKGQTAEPIVAILTGLINGVWVGMLGGSFPCIQHFILRLILYCNGHIPWNYASFLEYATDRLFLQRLGGGYRFIHDLLRQHFADNYR
ncbi:MAG: NACHT domain-containing protein [Coleofasciculus sp. S288]|nr:NACHT domain-containing protein [Coleofasciculus sp. S288]